MDWKKSLRRCRTGGETTPVNALDVSGGAVISSNYVAADTAAPADGLLVEGDVAIGNTALDPVLDANPGLKLDVNGNIKLGVPGVLAGEEDYIYFASGGYIYDDGNMLIFGHAP